jgi:hypothetical protein
MPKGPRGEKRPADVIGNAVKVIETLPLFRAAGGGRAGQLRCDFRDELSPAPAGLFFSGHCSLSMATEQLYREKAKEARAGRPAKLDRS